jgi:hypothetical protein
VSLRFFIDLIVQSTQPLREMNARSISSGVTAAGAYG